MSADFLGEREPIPPDQWSTKTKRPETLAAAMCPCCGRRPDSVDPLSPGWGWDTLEPTNRWVWCPMSIYGAEQTNLLAAPEMGAQP